MGTEHEAPESHDVIDPKTPMSFFFNLTPSVQKSLVWAMAFAIVGTAAAFCTAVSIEAIHRYNYRTETSIFNKENR